MIKVEIKGDILYLDKESKQWVVVNDKGEKYECSNCGKELPKYKGEK